MRSPQHLAAGFVALFLGYHSALALPQAGSPAVTAPVPWVTVDAAGSAQTITPGVFTTFGSRTTVNAPPASLVSIATYTLSPSGQASISTGLPPVAAATGTGASKAGAFLQCDNLVGTDRPICSPRRGSTLTPGRTYYVTWNIEYFQRSDERLELQFIYSSGPNTTSPNRIPPSAGFYAWSIPQDILTQRSASSPLAASIRLYREDRTTVADDLVLEVDGLEVYIASTVESAPSAGGGPNPAAIAVPIVVVVALIILGSFCFVSWRKTGVVPIVGGALRRRSSSGYGVRRSQSERFGGGVSVGTGAGAAAAASGAGVGAGAVKDETSIGIQLTDRDSWSPTARERGSVGRNVFQEEIQRQEREARLRQ